MRTQNLVRAVGLQGLFLSLAWFVAACAAPSAPTGSVSGLVSIGGVVAVSGVVVRAQDKATLTDAEGRFTLEGISVPYDVSLSQTSGDGWLHVIEGLTDRAPVIDPVGYPGLASTVDTVSISGLLSGGPGAWPLPAGRTVIVCVEGLDGFVFGCDDLSVGESSYAVDAALVDAGASDVRVHVLRIVVDVDGRPTGYEGYGSVALTIESGVPIVAPIVLDVATPVADFEIAFDVPGGTSVASGIVVLRLGTRGSLVLFSGTLTGSALTLPVPVLPGARYGVFVGVDAVGGGATSWTIADGLDGGTLAFPVPPQLATPPASATGVTTATPFEAVVAVPGPRTFRWTTGTGPDLALTTTRTSVTLPDVESAGFAWPSGVTYTWNVIAHGGATVDDAAASLDPSSVFLAIYAGLEPSTTANIAVTFDRVVTLAP